MVPPHIGKVSRLSAGAAVSLAERRPRRRAAGALFLRGRGLAPARATDRRAAAALGPRGLARAGVAACLPACRGPQQGRPTDAHAARRRKRPHRQQRAVRRNRERRHARAGCAPRGLRASPGRVPTTRHPVRVLHTLPPGAFRGCSPRGDATSALRLLPLSLVKGSFKGMQLFFHFSALFSRVALRLTLTMVRPRGGWWSKGGACTRDVRERAGCGRASVRCARACAERGAAPLLAPARTGLVRTPRGRRGAEHAPRADRRARGTGQGRGGRCWRASVSRPSCARGWRSARALTTLAARACGAACPPGSCSSSSSLPPVPSSSTTCTPTCPSSRATASRPSAPVRLPSCLPPPPGLASPSRASVVIRALHARLHG